MTNNFMNNYPYNTMNTMPMTGVPAYGQMPYQQQMQIPMMQQRPNDGRVYVNGRTGADAYPMPNGVNQITLWDTDGKRFYVKGYDNNGMPRVLEDNDYIPHVQHEPAQSQPVDMSKYATKDDLKAAVTEAFQSIQFPNMSSYVTEERLNKRLSGLSVGNGGRIVSVDESNGQ